MDSGFETIIYIILGIIFIVAQAARKKKQQAAQAPVNDADPAMPEPTPAMDMLEKFFGMEEEKPVRKFEAPTFQPPPIKAQPLSSDFADNEISSSGSMQKIGKEVNFLGEEIHDEIQVTRSKKKTEFDLRKAVIYSAILERRYF